MRTHRRHETSSQRERLARPGRRLTSPRATVGGEVLERRWLLAHDGSVVLGLWHNEESPFDVNADDRVSVMDALWIINDLNANGPRSLQGENGLFSRPIPIGDPGDLLSLGGFPDVNRDDRVSVSDALAVINQLNNEVDANDLIQFRLEVTDLTGAPITSIEVGQQFQLRAYVKDLRQGGQAQGVFSAYMDVTFTDALLDAHAPFEFAGPYSNGKQGTFAAGLLDEVGAFDGLEPLGPDERLLFHVTFTATAVGTAVFMADPADGSFAETGLFGISSVIAPEQISYGSVSLTIEESTLPTLSVNDPSVAEGDSGQTTMTFTVSLSAPATQAVTVNYATQDGTATAGQDYTATSGTLTFAVGEQTKTVNVTILGDTTAEPNETLFLVLSNAVGATIADGQGTGTIINDDEILPALSVNNPSVAEGDSGQTTMTFTVSLSAPATQAVTVNYATQDGTATAGQDYTATSGTLTFAVGEQTKTVNVTILGDTTVEPNETLFLVLSNAVGATIADGEGIGTITNDDGPTLMLPLGIVAEPTSGSQEAILVVRLSQPTNVPVTFNYSFSDGTAVAGADYTGVPGTITIPAGLTVGNIPVQILADNLDEPDETFTINITNLQGARLEQNTIQVIIQDVNGTLPTLSVADASVTEGTGGTATMNFVVSLSAASNSTVTVSWRTNNVTAEGNLDYTPNRDVRLIFAPGETTKTVSIPIVTDNIDEGNETFELIIYDSIGANIVRGTATGTIIDDDQQSDVLAITVDDFSQLEGTASNTATTFVFTVRLNRPVTAADGVVSVNYATGDITAIGGRDYVTTSGTLSFAVGEIQKAVEVLVRPDTVVESDEQFRLILSAPSPGLAFARSYGVATIEDDEPDPVVFVADAFVNELLDGTGEAEVVIAIAAGINLEREIVVSYGTVNGTAIAGQDYTAVSGTVTIIGTGDMRNRAVVRIPILADSVANEPDETFLVRISGAIGGTIEDNEGVVTIMDRGGATNKLARFSVATTNLAGDPINAVDVGQSFYLVLLAEDLRTNPRGVINAFADILYDPLLLEIEGEIIYEPVFNAAQSGNTSSPGLIDEAGAFTLTEWGPRERPVLRIQMRAKAAGTALFQTDPPEGLARHPGLAGLVNEFGEIQLQPVAFAYYTGASLAIGSTRTVSIADASITEGNSGTTTMNFVVTLSSASTQSIVINYATGGGTAFAGIDYVGASGSITFSPGETSKTIGIAINGDTLHEADETFEVTLSSTDPNVQFARSRGIGTILDDDPAPVVSVQGVTSTEGNSGTKDFVFTVSLSTASGQEVRVNAATADGTAIAGDDYNAQSSTIIFAPGETSKSFTVRVRGDLIVEPDETFTVSLSSPVNATISATNGTATGTIQNDDTEEGQPGAISGVVWLDLNNNGIQDAGEMALQGVTVRLRGATSANVSFSRSAVTNANGQYRFENVPAGTYYLYEDQPNALLDGKETPGPNGQGTIVSNDVVMIELAAGMSATGYGFAERGLKAEHINKRLTLASMTHQDVMRIISANGSTTRTLPQLPSLSISDPTVVEGNSGTTTMTFTVSLSAPAPQAVTVNYATQDGTATAGQDYTAASGTLTFAVGEQTKTVNVTILGDTTVEPNETLFLVLSNAVGATIADGQGTGTITNDDGVSLSVNDVSVVEGNSGTTTMTFTVSLSAPAPQAVTVNYATQDGTATAGQDYTAASGTLTFAVGEQTKTVNVTILGDTTVEPNETLFLVLSNALGATIADGQGTGTITNDDGVSLSVNDVSVVEGNSGTTTMTFTVSLSAPAPQAVTVNYATQDGTATAGQDYTATSGTLTFAVGEQTKTVNVTILGDTTVEPNETLFLVLSNALGATIADGQGTGTITNDDGVSLSVNDVSVVEGNSGTTTMTFTVSLSAPAPQAVTVNYATQDGTATAGQDYTATSGTLTFAVGEQTKTVNVTILGDTTVEPNETLFLVLSNAVGATIADGQGTGTITNDDGVSLSVNDVSVVEGNSGTTTMTFTVSLSAPAPQAVTVNYATQDGTATAGQDYTATSGTLTFAVGEQTKTVNVTILGDTTVEPNETLFLVLSNAVGATIADGQGTGTITNDDHTSENPLVEFRVEVTNTTGTPISAIEVGQQFQLRVYVNDLRDGAAAQGVFSAYMDVTFPENLVDVVGSLQFSEPYVNGRQGTIEAGMLNEVGAFDGVSPLGGDERLFVTVTMTATAAGTAVFATDPPEGAFAETGLYGISSEIPHGRIVYGTTSLSITTGSLPALSVNDVSVAEEDSGETTMTFTVSLSAPAPQAVTVNYATQDGTATEGQDYTAASGTLTFAVGEQFKTVNVTILGDTTAEPDETLLLVLSNPVGATIADGQGTGTIVDNDGSAASLVEDFFNDDSSEELWRDTFGSEQAVDEALAAGVM